ncbi:MAG: carbohydrate binding family 9 domain-containing protein [Pyrinomonadaceae bacterium]|nr:carbohydrate binding family 9 domain-containing protein [Sphingobacteriaceae bacterium]
MLAQDSLLQGNFPPSSNPLTIYASKANGNIKLDGKLTESDWQYAIPYTNFIQVDPNQGSLAKYQTVIKILFDNKYLYMGAYCKDIAGKSGVRVQDFRRDFGYFDNDLLGVALDPFNGKRNATAFQTNPYGALRDLQAFDDNIFDREWDALWSARSNISDSGWACEFAIPWKTLRYPKANNDSTVWGINFNRIARRENENSTFSPYPRSFDGYRMTYAGLLKGIVPPAPSINIQINPYFVNEYNSKKETGKNSSSNYNTKLGGEIKYSPTVHSTIDLTFNTDFAQADADRQVNNLTRFSVFFPERRQFFLENAGLFDAGNQVAFKPFFSRTIGLDSNGNPIPIDAGARFTDKNNKYSLGALYIHQRKTANTQAANLSVLRYLKNYGTQNNIGALLTNRIDEANDSLKTNFNTTVSLTGFNRFSNKLRLNYTATASKTTGNYKDDGLATFTRLAYESNNFSVFWNTSYVSKSFNAQMGFVSRNNFVKNYVDAFFIKRKQAWFPKFLRSWEPGLEFDVYQDPGNLKLQEAYIAPYPIFFIFNNGTKIIGRGIFNWQNLPVNFNPIGVEIAAGSYQYNQVRAEYYSDQSSKLSYVIDLTTGGYFNGKITSFTGSLRYAPSPHVAFNVDYQANFLKKVGVLLEDLNTALVTPNIRMAVNPRLQMNVFYQYNSATERSRWNARFSWEYKPLSYLYLVWNENKTAGLREDQTIGKISYLKQF